MNSGILLLDCPGIVASTAQFLYAHGANILHADRHQTTRPANSSCELSGLSTGLTWKKLTFREQFDPIAQEFQIQWRPAWSAWRPRIAIFVSRYQHCLVDLLYRNQIGELAVEVVLVVSNHVDAKPLASFTAFLSIVFL